MKITFSELEKWEEEYVKNKLKNHSPTFIQQPISQSNINKIKSAEMLVIFVHSHITSEILSQLPNLKYIVTMSTGFDNIDLEACKKRKIKIANVPHYGENTVAEYTFSLILNISRNTNEAIEKTKRDDFSIKGLIGFDLKNKTLGVIGAGNIGQHVIKMAKAFEMKILVNSLKKDKKLSKKYNFSYTSLPNLLKNSDIITIHVPLNQSTYHLINKENINLIKKGAFLINTSRGQIVETSAILDALNKKILAGAALDVLEGESEMIEEKQLISKNAQIDYKLIMENHILLKNKNILITPHCAFYTKEALKRILDTTLNNISSFSSKKPSNLVN